MILNRRVLLCVLVPVLLTAPADGQPTPAKPRPAIVVEATYPGANALVVADTLGAPIEEQVKGVEKMLHMVSRCGNDGSYSLTVTFAPEVDINKARVLVQNRVGLALPVLPEVVKLSGVTVKKAPRGVLLIAALTSPDSTHDTLYVSNYASIQLKDELVRVAGVGEVVLFGQRDYNVRIWLDPLKLAARGLSAADVVKALRAQNLQVPAGQIGKPPDGKGPQGPLNLKTIGRLSNWEDIEQIIVKAGAEGNVVCVKDIASAELGASSYDGHVSLNGKPGVALGIYLSWQARAQEVSTDVQKELTQLRARLPKHLRLDVPFDFTQSLEGAAQPTAPEHLLLEVTLPDAASLERTRRVLEQCERILAEIKGVQDVLTLSDNPFDSSRRGFSNLGCILVRLAPVAKSDISREQLTRTIRTELEEKVPEMALRVRHLSQSGRFFADGFPIGLAIHGPEMNKVREFAEKLAERLGQSKKVTDVRANRDSASRPQLYLDVDRAAVAKQGVKMEDVFNTLQVTLGSVYVNDFNRFGRTWQVHVQAAPGRVEDLKQLKLRNARGEIVPLGSLATIRDMAAPAALWHLDGRPMVDVTANPTAGVSLAQARALCETLAEEVRKDLRLPAEYRHTWLP